MFPGNYAQVFFDKTNSILINKYTNSSGMYIEGDPSINSFESNSEEYKRIT